MSPAVVVSRALLVLSLIGVVLVGCGPSSVEGSSATGGLAVATTTTVFADLIANVGGSAVSVTSLVPRNGDVHTFEPKPADIRTVAAAKLLVMNGLGLDDWLEKTITNAAADGSPVIKLGEDLPGVTLLPGEDPGTQNPHLWMDVKYAELYVDKIEAALASADPADASTFAMNATAYKARLEQLDASVRSKVASIPEAKRKLVVFHDAFPYYAREYGITIVGVAVEAPGQDPSAGYTADLIAAIKAAGVKAIFSESQFPTKLVDQLASETGAKVVANLYDDALGDPPITSYEALITWDTDQLVGALR
jgi:ABC-type Zn uptake system ZnuABC Zn-binding protein ZnuA